MKKEHLKTALIIGVALIIVFVIYRLYKSSRVNQMQAISGNNNETVTGNYTDPVNNSAILKKGMSGNSVKELQKAANEKLLQRGSSLAPIIADGAFGSATEERIQQLSGGMLSSAKSNISINSVKALPSTNTY